MALQKNYDYQGKTANYWKITRIIPDYVKGNTLIELRLYWDKDSRDTDVKNHLDYREVKTVKKVDLTRAQAYVEVKKSVLNKDQEETNWFNDAIDVLEE